MPRLLVGLAALGAGVALQAQSRLGLSSWSVMHEGLGLQAGVALGTADFLVSIPVLLAWFPLRQLPGVGTLAAATLVGPATNLALGGLARPSQLPGRFGFLIVGTVLIAVGTALYLTADLGPGPRDGLMTGLHALRGWSVRSVRTAIELAVLAIGFALGGTVGVGTVIHALTVGPLVQLNLRWLDRTGVVLRPVGASPPSPPGTEAQP
jgi:uncharacterized membrane protein YczE